MYITPKKERTPKFPVVEFVTVCVIAVVVPLTILATATAVVALVARWVLGL